MELSLPVLISRTAGYAIRMSGGVGGGGREVTPYPYRSNNFRPFQILACKNAH